MTTPFQTAPVKQARFSLPGTIDISAYLQRVNITNQSGYEDVYYHPFGTDHNDDLNHAREGEPFIVARHPFGTGPAVGRTLVPGFTNLRGIAVPRMMIKQIRDSGDMVASDDDIAREIIYRMYWCPGLVGTNSDYVPNADRTITQCAFDTGGYLEFLNLTQHRINVGDKVGWRLPEPDELKRENMGGLDPRKVVVVIDRVEKFATRADKDFVMKKLRVDTPEGVEFPYVRALKQPDGRVVYGGGIAMKERDMFAESFRDHTSLVAFQAVRVFKELVKQLNPGNVEALNRMWDAIDLEKFAGLVDVETNELISYKLSAGSVAGLQKTRQWKENAVLTHRAILSFACGVSDAEVYPLTRNNHSRCMQKNGCLKMFAHGQQAHDRVSDRHFGVCFKACNPGERGDVLVKNSLKV
jgi:hypothetical protein